MKASNIFTTSYQDWSMCSRESNTWRMADLHVAENDGENGIDLYLVRQHTKNDTFYIHLDRDDAYILADQLANLLGGKIV